MLKNLLILIVTFVSGFFYCMPNNIIWQRVPSLFDQEYINPHIYNCLLLCKGEYLIAVDEDWLSIYDSQTGIPIINKIFEPKYDNKDNSGILHIFSTPDSNVIMCCYRYCNNDSCWFNYIYYEIPSLKEIKRKYKSIYYLSVSPNLQYGSTTFVNDSTIDFAIIDLNSSKIILEGLTYRSEDPLPGDYSGLDIKFSNDNEYVIIRRQDNKCDVSLFSLKEEKMLWHDEINEIICSAEISNNLEYIIITSLQYIYIYDFSSHELLKKIELHKTYVRFPFSVISFNNKYISTINNFNEIIIYDLELDSILYDFTLNEKFNNIPGERFYYDFLYSQKCFLNENKIVICGFNGYYVYNIETNKLVNLLSTHSMELFVEPALIKFINNNEYLMTIGPDKTIIWDAKTGAFIKALNLARSADQSNTIAIHPDTKNLIYSVDTTIYFYNIVDEELTREITTRSDVLHLDINGNGRYLGYTMKDSTFAIYDLDLDKVIFWGKGWFNIHDPSGNRFYSIALSPNNLCAVTIQSGDKYFGYDYYTRGVYDFIDFKEYEAFFVRRPVKFFNSDSILISTGDYIGDIRTYKYSKEHEEYMTLNIYEQKYISSVATLKDNIHFITSGPTIWNIETGDSIQLHAEPELDDMDYVAVSNNGKMLAAMSPEGRIVVWDVEDLLTDVENEPLIIEDNNLILYPNPTNDILTVEWNDNIKPIRISIINLNAIECKKKIIYENNNYIKFKTTDLSKGIYFVKIKLRSGKLIVKKIIIL
jgi:WD40 repeat protein